MRTEMAFKLKNPETGKVLHGLVTVNGNYLLISFKGYGDCGSIDGAGNPIVIRVPYRQWRRTGPDSPLLGGHQPRNPTNSVSLALAKESLREPEPVEIPPPEYLKPAEHVEPPSIPGSVNRG